MFLTKFKICVYTILIFNINLYSQENALNNQERGRKLWDEWWYGVFNYLSPDTTKIDRILMFLAVPAIDPQYSLSLEIQKDNHVLRFRTFNTNYWALLVSKYKNNIKINRSKTIDSTGVEVSKEFADRLELLFQTQLKNDPKTLSLKPDTYDGTIYYFLNRDFKREIYSYDFSNNKRYHQLVSVCENIACDLKNNNFKEEMYFDLIDDLIEME